MTTDEFRRLALGFEGAAEGAHMGHPDFRVDGRIFATLQGADRGMVKLTPDQQARFVVEHPAIFVEERGAWGRQGCTRVCLSAADSESVGEAMTLAWRNVRKPPVKRPARARTRR